MNQRSEVNILNSTVDHEFQDTTFRDNDTSILDSPIKVEKIRTDPFIGRFEEAPEYH